MTGFKWQEVGSHQLASGVADGKSRGSEPDGPGAVGVRVLEPGEVVQDAAVYYGVSYCDAVRRAGEGETLRVLPGSIRICRWAPVVLGLKAPEGSFEERLAPRLAYPVAGLLLAPLERFPGVPDVVLVRATSTALRQRIEAVGPGQVWEDGGGRLNRSAIPLVRAGKRTAQSRLVVTMNRVLAALARSERWQTLTHRIFRHRLPTMVLDTLISRIAADMSMCRNSTVIPLQTGRANVSFFCTGGITWGRNRADHLTSGWPAGMATDDLWKKGEG